jgi:hypothetical protein
VGEWECEANGERRRDGGAARLRKPFSRTPTPCAWACWASHSFFAVLEPLGGAGQGGLSLATKGDAKVLVY